MNWKRGLRGLCVSVLCACGTAVAVNTPEVEPNDSKGTATVVNPGGVGMDVGDTISGTTTGIATSGGGSNSLDYFRIKTKAMPLGIYRYRLVFTTGAGTAVPGQTVSIRGLSQSAGVPVANSDATVQNGVSTGLVANAKTLQWYGFGKQEELYVRVAGTTATTTSYSGRLERVLITPTVASGSIIEGNISIKRGSGNTDDMDFWVYDNSLNAIDGYGHDQDDATGLTRAFAIGTYYIPYGGINFANNLGSPSDDLNRTGTVMDFPDVVATSANTTVAISDTISIQSLGGTPETALSRSSPFEIPWVQMNVAINDIPTNPTCMAGAAPASVINDGTGSTTFTVVVTPGTHPDSVTHTVTADLSAIGGDIESIFVEGPTNTFTFTQMVADGTPAGPYTITTMVQETSPRTRRTQCNATVTIVNPPTGNCCTNDGCLIATQRDCLAQSGSYGGDGTTCAGCACASGGTPVNDDISGALALVDGVAQTGSTCSATIDSATVTACNFQTIAAGGVWYKIHGNGNMATVALCGSGYDTRLSAYCGNPNALPLTCVTGNDDFCATTVGNNYASSVTFCTQSGANYYLLVHGFTTGSIGNFVVLYTDGGSPCTPTVLCIPTGACCTPSGCSTLTSDDCATAGGTYLGDGMPCNTITINDAFSSMDSFPIFIPDYSGGVPGMASSSIVIGSGHGNINGLAVRIGLDHTYVGDLIGTLSNGSTSVTLFNRLGVGANLGAEYVFIDSASVAFPGTADPVPGGPYRPYSALSALDGQPFEGTWTLTITDNAGIDTGHINSFAFSTITTTTNCSSCPACAADYNNDGGVDGQDVASFFPDWENAAACADVNEDGGVDGQDVAFFFQKWEAGGC